MALVKHDAVESRGAEPGVSARRISSEEYGASSSTASEVTLSPGAVIPPHYHDVDSTIVIISGTFEVIPGSEAPVKRNGRRQPKPRRKSVKR